jgi:hypothetical protein
MFKRFTLPLILVLLFFSIMPVSAAGTGEGRILGAVPIKGGAQILLGGGKLTYHNGPVMHTNKVYTIYWVPTGSTVASGYSTLVDRYFKDVAAASGTKTNVYYSDNQYYSLSGATKKYITYKSTFGASYLDKHAYPASGCPLYTGVSRCLTDLQLQTEIKRVIAANGWVKNATTEFFIFTAKGIGSCYGTDCAFTAYCAYHSWDGSLLYANMPYTGTNLAACGTPYSPNNNFPADSTISVTSHEHNETITDPNGTGWWDSAGYENGDKCAWIFGAIVTSSHKYNQTINGHNYLTQEEWSNKSNKCVLSGQ